MFSTSSTFTSLYRLASTRRAWSQSASTTIVMRETWGFSVRPTVSESMLNARRRNSEATRVKTPGLFSTCTTNVFSISFSSVSRRLDDRTWPANHFVQRRARRDHRIDRIFLLHLEVDQDWPHVIVRHFDRRHDLGALRNGNSANAERVGELHEIGTEDRRSFVVAFVEKLLPLANHPQVAVVDDGDVDLQIFLYHRRQFTHRHLKSAVADHDPNIGFWPSGLHADRRGQRKSHGSESAGGDQRARLLVLVILRFPHLVLAHVRDDDGVALPRLAPQIVDDMRGIEVAIIGQILNVADGRVTLEPVDISKPLATFLHLHIGKQLPENSL